MVQNNVMAKETPEKLYDLKGSKEGRTQTHEQNTINPLKDLDFDKEEMKIKPENQDIFTS